MRIISNNKKLNVSKLELPILISGKCHSGASYFSIALVSELINSGERVIYFCQAKPGVELLRKLVRPEFIPSVIIAEPGNLDDFKEKLSACQDIKERVIFIKNIEQTMDTQVQLLLSKAKTYILSGDFDLAEKVKPINPKTTIIFSDSTRLKKKLPHDYGQYNGYLDSGEYTGQVRLEETTLIY
jgi:hypothetical protein